MHRSVRRSDVRIYEGHTCVVVRKSYLSDINMRQSLLFLLNHTHFHCSREFQQLFNPTHGNCFMFNSGWYNSSQSPKTSSKTGRRHGKLNTIVQNGCPTHTIGIIIFLKPSKKIRLSSTFKNNVGT